MVAKRRQDVARGANLWKLDYPGREAATENKGEFYFLSLRSWKTRNIKKRQRVNTAQNSSLASESSQFVDFTHVIATGNVNRKLAVKNFIVNGPGSIGFVVFF